MPSRLSNPRRNRRHSGTTRPDDRGRSHHAEKRACDSLPSREELATPRPPLPIYRIPPQMPKCRHHGPNTGTRPLDTSKTLNSRAAKFLKAGGLLGVCRKVCIGTHRALCLTTNIRTLKQKELMNAPYHDFYLRDPDAIR